MSYAIKKLLRHMSWANQKVFESVRGLPDEALQSFLVNEDWSAAHILHHIAESADWYVFCLTQSPWKEPALPKKMADIESLQKSLLDSDAIILAQADLPEAELTIEENEETWQTLRSTVLTQTIHHATEHRTQLIDALESRGYQPISLDDIDLWCFARFERGLLS